MTDQELFDKVATHLLTQNAKSQESDGTCAYRGENGTKCSIGCLIPDDKYDEDFEGKRVGSCAELREAAGISQNQVSLAGALVVVHDLYLVEDWPAELTSVADIHYLNSEVVRGMSP